MSLRASVTVLTRHRSSVAWSSIFA